MKISVRQWEMWDQRLEGDQCIKCNQGVISLSVNVHGSHRKCAPLSSEDKEEKKRVRDSQQSLVNKFRCLADQDLWLKHTEELESKALCQELLIGYSRRKILPLFMTMPERLHILSEVKQLVGDRGGIKACLCYSDNVWLIVCCLPSQGCDMEP